MPFHITCDCGRLTVVPDDAAGQSVRCAHCDSELLVPEVTAPLPPPVPPPTPTDQRVIVVAADASQSRRVSGDPNAQAIHLLAAGLVTLALLSTVPIILAMRQPLADQPISAFDGRLLAPWAVVILLTAILHFAYTIYLLQVRDYSCVWVVSLFLLAMSTGYALLLGMRLLAAEGNRVVAMLALDGNLFSSNQQTLWCFLMMTLTGVMSYQTGRTASRLHAQHRQVPEEEPLIGANER